MSRQPVPADSWVSDLFASIDRRDTDLFVGFLTEDAIFRFGNQPPVHGRAAIAEAVGQFFSQIAGLAHDVRDTWDAGDAVIVAGDVTYTRHSGSEVTLPFADIFRMRDGLVREYLIYMDVNPLFADE